VGSFDPKPAYLRRLAELIDWKAIRASGLKLVVGPALRHHREYLDHILLENDVEITVIRNTRDPYSAATPRLHLGQPVRCGT